MLSSASVKALPSASDKETLFTEIFSESSNLDDLGIYAAAFSSKIKLKLHNFLTPKMVKKVKRVWS